MSDFVNDLQWYIKVAFSSQGQRVTKNDKNNLFLHSIDNLDQLNVPGLGRGIYDPSSDLPRSGPI